MRGEETKGEEKKEEEKEEEDKESQVSRTPGSPLDMCDRDEHTSARLGSGRLGSGQCLLESESRMGRETEGEREGMCGPEGGLPLLVFSSLFLLSVGEERQVFKRP